MSLFMFLAFFSPSGMDNPSVRLSVISKWVQGSPTSPLSVFHSKNQWPLTSAAVLSDILFASPCLLSCAIILLYLTTSAVERLKVQTCWALEQSFLPLSVHLGFGSCLKQRWMDYTSLYISIINCVAISGGSLTFCFLHVSCGRLSSPSGPSNCWPH